MSISIKKQGTKVEMFYLIKLSSDVRIFITPSEPCTAVMNIIKVLHGATERCAMQNL